ncbi:lycopene cyclase family protein [Microlunatus aurantiacus]|uniref:Lycopene cyclase family protein n=1 Tax=Microlunatus aurantiacus TaxID=446786 RepID=A0ABP7DLF5_9ACTN
MTNTASARRTVEVLVLGLGPSGRSLLSRLTARGVNAIGIDPAPERPWTATYALWSYELPAWLPAGVVAGTDTVSAFARTEHVIADRYVVLDPARLHAALAVDGDRLLAGRVDTVVDPHTVRLADGRHLSADVVVDARGSRLSPAKAQQTAVGVVLPRDRTGAISGSWFMDWRHDNGAPADAPPSFLYVVPVGDDRVLVEETCLVGRPPLGYRELRTRLAARLAHRGVRLSGDEPEEHVRFAVEPEHLSRSGRAGPLVIGARGGIMHPATGYSVAPSLRLADDLAVLIAAGVPADAADLLRSRRRQVVRLLRGAGLATLLRLPPDGVPAFFEAFFRLPPDRQRAYLTGHDQPGGVAAAMAQMVSTLDPRLTALAIGSTVGSTLGSLTRPVVRANRSEPVRRGAERP